nr:LacI family DNA-binding transcriptional regulator [Kineococcus vitellinus]
MTIADVARAAGVSTGAVSYALNGKPGVSEATRARVIQVAGELGWRPHSAARSLSVARTGTVGLVLARPASTLGDESFYMQLITGIEAELAQQGTGLLLQMVPSEDACVEVYRRWVAQGRVDGVLVSDIVHDDPRPAFLREAGLPAVAMGGDAALGLPRVVGDDERAVQQVVAHLAELGHRHVARVSGLPGLLHVRLRDEAFTAAARSAGLHPQLVSTDFTARASRRATERLLQRRVRPTAVVYDNDVMAVAGLAVVQAHGLRVPQEVALVAWDDSALCSLVHPRLTAVARDIRGLGALAARRLLRLLAEGDSGADAGAGAGDEAEAQVAAAADVPAPASRLVVRESTSASPPETR